MLPLQEGPVLYFTEGIDYVKNGKMRIGNRKIGQEEKALISRLKYGEESAFREFVSMYRRNVYNLALRILSDREEAYDLSQEVFLAVYTSINSFKEKSSLRTWIYRVTVNRCLNRLDKWKRRKRKLQVPLENDEEDRLSPIEKLSSEQPHPDRMAESVQLQEGIKRALSELPVEFRLAVVLRDIDGLTYEEISEALKVGLGTVKSRINRGRSLLKDKLRDFL